MNDQQKSKVAFVIVGWNNQDLLSQCLGSIRGQTYKNRLVIFIDNNSTDDSVAFIRAHYPEVVLLPQTKNTGFARGNNIGIRRALEDKQVRYIALINTDATIEYDWTERVVEFAILKPRGAQYQGTTLDYFERTVIDSTHIYVSRNGQATQGNWRCFFTNDLGPKRVMGVNAAACLISRDFIETQPFQDYFDESLFMYLEDVDVALRAMIMGWDSYLVPGARAYHMGSASSGKNPGFSIFMTFRNNAPVLFKNLPLRIIFRLLPHLIRGDIDTIRELGRRRKSAAALKVVTGRISGLLRIPLYLAKRSKLKEFRRIDRDYLWQLMHRGY